MKVKILKKMISALCVATIATSSVAPSVGAFKVPANAQADVVNSVNQLNDSLGRLNKNISDMIIATNEDGLKKCSANDYDRQVKLVTLLSSLEASQKHVNELNEVVIYNLELANNIKNQIDDLNNSCPIVKGELLGGNNYWFSNGFFEYSKAISEKLENIEKMLKENNNNSLANLKKDFKAKSKEFYDRWTKHTKFDKLIGKYGKNNDPTYQDRQNAHYWCNNAFGSENEQDMRKAIECCNKAIDSMNKYENDNSSAFQLMNLHQLNVFVGNGAANNSADAVEHDKALIKKLKDAWNSHIKYDGDVDLYPALSDLRKVLESDSFKDKKAGAEFLADLICSSHWIVDGGEGRWLFDQVILPVLPDKINEFKNLYINKGGKKFVNALGNIDQKIAKVLEDTPHTYLWKGRDLDGIVYNIFKKAKFKDVKRDSYKKFRETGDKEWNPVVADLVKLDQLVSEMESDKTLKNLDQFVQGNGYKRMCEKLDKWFDGYNGIYSSLTGHSYYDDVVAQLDVYTGQYPVLHNLYGKIGDFRDSFIFGAGKLPFKELKERVHNAAENLRKASEEVIQFFNNNH